MPPLAIPTAACSKIVNDQNNSDDTWTDGQKDELFRRGSQLRSANSNATPEALSTAETDIEMDIRRGTA